MKVLVIQQKMIGDVLASSTICQTLKIQNPDWEIHFMIYPNCLPVVEHHPYIDKIILFDAKQNQGLMSLVKFGKKLNSLQYDIVIDAYGKWESVIPCYFSKAKMRVGYKKSYTSLCYTHLVVPKKGINAEAIYHRLQLANAVLDQEINLIFPKIYLTEEEQSNAKKSIAEKLNIDVPMVMVSVLGSEKIKSLPALQMAEVLDYLVTQNKNILLLFNYIPTQIEEAKEIYNACKSETKEKIVFDFYTQSLREFLAILEQCDALIGNEGGAVNMAKALGIKTFTIFSPWINKNSWNMLEDEQNHISVHLQDYYPELYEKKHPKKFKSKSLEMYPFLSIDLYKNQLKSFLARI